MCSAPDIKAPPPAPAPPPVLTQIAPKSTATASSEARNKSGMSRYKIGRDSKGESKTTALGGIPRKTGV